jgi:intracellular multiplication protein IcmE
MTNNINDEFDPDQIEPTQPTRRGGVGSNLGEAWRTQPLFKLIVIISVVAIAIIGALSVFGGPATDNVSRLTKVPDVREAPGGVTTPAFQEQNRIRNQQMAEQALQTGGSALPTPIGQNNEITELTQPNRNDPLNEFRAETERLRAELQQQKEQTAQQLQLIQQNPQQLQQQQQQQEQFDDSLAQAMQRQLQQLNESWTPTGIKTVSGPALKDGVTNTGTNNIDTALGANAASIPPALQPGGTVASNPTLVAGGTVNYAQLLTEANSDVPGAILAQIVSGPLAGGRAIGQFQVLRNYLVLSFNLVTLKGKDYRVNAVALDPDTTLGGMATEVDNRYFDRLILPAAGAFMQEFGNALGQGSSSTSVTNNGIIIDQAKRGYKDAAFAGLGEAGTTLGEFFKEEAQAIKPLVRVAAGTPLGIFFLTTVKENSTDAGYAGQGNYYGGGYPPGPGGTLDPALLAAGANPFAASGLSNYNAANALSAAYGNALANSRNPYGNVGGGAGLSPYAGGGYGTQPQFPSNGSVTILAPGYGGAAYGR